MSNPNPTYVLGMGSYVPSNKVDNHALSLRVDTSDEWIRSRTGIRERCLAEDDQACSDLALEASVRALKDADIERDQIDLVIVATITPDMSFPSTACLLQHKLGLGKISSFDLEAACSGFLYALDVADGMLASNRYHNALVVGAEKMSSILDWDDRTTCVLFGDGAGAAVLSKKGAGHELLGFQCGADGSDPTVLHKPAGGSLLPASQDTLNERKHFLKMNGREIFKSAVRVMERAVRELLVKHEISMDEVDHVIPHQANVRIVESLAQRLEISMDKFFCNLENYGTPPLPPCPWLLMKGGRLAGFVWPIGVLVALAPINMVCNIN